MEVLSPAGAALGEPQSLHPGLRNIQGELLPVRGLAQQPQRGGVPVLLAAEVPVFDAQDADVVVRRGGQAGRHFLIRQLHARNSGPKLWGSSSGRVKTFSSPAPLRQMTSMSGANSRSTWRQTAQGTQ